MNDRDREGAFAAWCHREWQTHTARKHHVGAQPLQYARAANPHIFAVIDFRIAAWQIEATLAGLEILGVELAVFEPGLVPAPRPWQEVWSERLMEYPAIGLAVAASQETVFQKAKLTVNEKAAMRLHLVGDSKASIAAAMSERPQTVSILIRNAEQRLASLPTRAVSVAL